MRCAYLAAVLAAAAHTTLALDLDTSDADSIKAAASTIAYGMLSYYTGNITDTPDTIAILPEPYYWWEAGAMWGAMIDYWHYTGDASYNDVTYQALVSQIGPDFDFMLKAQTFDEGNDDQAFWGFAAMSAAEKGFKQPSAPNPSWLTVVENLWNSQAARWGLGTCNGGLKWQIYPQNNGYDYKNSVSNGAFFQLSARLARFTGNQTYVDWAEKVWDWTTGVGLMDGSYNVLDGAQDTTNCTDIDHTAWSYSLGIYLYGAATMYNYTDGGKTWQTRTTGLLDASKTFFSPYDNATDVMYEFACETQGNCDTDQYSFKAYLARFMWASTQMAAFTTSKVTQLLDTSARAAADACSGLDNSTCGTKWYVGGYDGVTGVGQQMSAMELIQGLLVSHSTPPGTSGDAPSPSETQHPSSTRHSSSSTTKETPTTSSHVKSSSVHQGTSTSPNIAHGSSASSSIAHGSTSSSLGPQPTSMHPSTFSSSMTASGRDSSQTSQSSSIATKTGSGTTSTPNVVSLSPSSTGGAKQNFISCAVVLMMSGAAAVALLL